MLTGAAAGVADGVRVEIRVALGPAREALVQACRDDVDLLVMGSRAYGPLRSVLLGSVSRHVVDHAPCPVIVVPRGARARLVGPPPVAAASSA
jgi:nucleotide-binding universal stress UspA family protein